MLIIAHIVPELSANLKVKEDKAAHAASSYHH